MRSRIQVQLHHDGDSQAQTPIFQSAVDELEDVAKRLGGRLDSNYAGLHVNFSFPGTRKGETLAVYFHDMLRGRGFGSEDSPFAISRARQVTQ